MLAQGSGCQGGCGGRLDRGRADRLARGVQATTAACSVIRLTLLIGVATCSAIVRKFRRPRGVCCPGCGNDAVAWNGRDDTQPARQRSRSRACAARLDELARTVLAGTSTGCLCWCCVFT